MLCLGTKEADIRLLLLDPESVHHLRRINELNYPLTTTSILGYVERIKVLQGTNKNIKLLIHSDFLRHKYYFIDDVLYLGFRLRGKFSDKAQIWKIGKDSYLYKSFHDQFNDYWEKLSKGNTE
jgi:hypothetical protein